MEKYTSFLSFFSSFLTVAAVAGITGVLSDSLGKMGKKAGIPGKMRYLCALAVAASLAAPLPKFFATIKNTLAVSPNFVDRFTETQMGGDSLSGRLFSSAAADALAKNAGDELRTRLSLTEQDLCLFFTVEEVSSESSSGDGEASDERTSGEGTSDEVVSGEEPSDGDRRFAIQRVRAELYTLRAAAQTDEIRRYLASFACPVEVEECLSIRRDTTKKGAS